MCENWNYHTFVSIPLEDYGKKTIGRSFYSADDIDKGEFVDAMISILSFRFPNSETWKEFIDLCRPYTDVPLSKIGRENTIEIFEEFERLLKT